jgi:hypothetical protein
MKPNAKKLLTIMLIAAMILSAIPVFAGINDYPASSIWIQPGALTGGYGTLFNVLVWTNVSERGFTWEVGIRYDTDVFQLNSITHTAGDPDGKDWLDQRLNGPDGTPQSTTLTGPVYGSHNGTGTGDEWDYVSMGGTCLGDDYVDNYTSGKLCRAQFEVIGAPAKYETIESSLWIDHASTYVLRPNLNTVTTTKYDAHYSYAWEYPPSPWLAIEGGNVASDKWEYGPLPPSAIGTLFDADVVIKSLDANWKLTNVTLDLYFNDTVIELISVTFDILWGATFWSYTPGPLGLIYLEAKSPTSTPAGDVLIATIKFNVTTQGLSPPDVYVDTSVLDIENEVLYDTIEEITPLAEDDGLVEIYPEQVLALPWIEVGDVVMGPEPSRGARFNVSVDIKMLHPAWYAIGFEVRVWYDDFLLSPVAIYEGDFMASYAAMQNGSLGTFFASFWEDCYWCDYSLQHALFGVLILPNSTGWWNGPFPEGNGTLAILEFEVAYQSFGEPDMMAGFDVISNLGLGVTSDPSDYPVDIPLAPPVNGTYTITTDWPGRVLDLYGGALIEGYGSHPFPPPYGGQGPHNTMDLVTPQSEVKLFANVTYNYWPVQNKMVGFEVEFWPNMSAPSSEMILLKQTALTDTEGVASIMFEMPWPCDNPEDLLGKWKVTATVSISDVRINDTLWFDYDYMIRTWKVTTDKFEYNHCDEVGITIEYGTHAQQMYPALLSVLILDDLIVPIGMVLVELEVGGAEFCTYNNNSITVWIHIPKWAFAGIATIHVNWYDMDPTEGGVAWTPEYTPPPEIAIQPY